jgi:hypothetical protein
VSISGQASDSTPDESERFPEIKEGGGVADREGNVREEGEARRPEEK